MLRLHTCLKKTHTATIFETNKNPSPEQLQTKIHTHTHTHTYTQLLLNRSVELSAQHSKRMGNFHLVSKYRKTTQSSLTRGQEMWLLGTSFDFLWGYSLGWALCSKVRAPPAAALGKNHRCSASSQRLLLCCKGMYEQAYMVYVWYICHIKACVPAAAPALLQWPPQGLHSAGS